MEGLIQASSFHRVIIRQQKSCLAAAITPRQQRANIYEVRAEALRARFNCSRTIGFPQTTETKFLRLDLKRRELDVSIGHCGTAISRPLLNVRLDVGVHGDVMTWREYFWRVRCGLYAKR